MKTGQQGAPLEANRRIELHRVILKAGTVVLVQGIPTTLRDDTIVDTAPANAWLLTNKSTVTKPRKGM